MCLGVSDRRREEKGEGVAVVASLLRMLVGVVLCAFFWGCSGGCSGGGEKADFVFINGAEPETLDPAIVTGQPEGRIVGELFEGLLRKRADGTSEPGVAERWTVSDDGKVYRFFLREGAVWSDGKPVRAQDFVDAWKRVLMPGTGAQYHYQLFCIRNAELFAGGKERDFAKVGVRAVGEKELEVELEKPTPYFLDLCAFWTFYPVRVDVVEREGDDWIKPGKVVGNGPYLLEEWKINDRIRLRKNPLYWDAEGVGLGVVDVLPISKANTAFNFYASGAADLVMDKGLVPPALMRSVMEREDFHFSPFLGVYFLRFNVGREPFDDERVRKAFGMAVDKEALVRRITRAGEVAAQGFVPPGMVGYAGSGGLAYNPEKARELLAEAGYARGEGFPLSTYLYSEGELNEAIGVELQSVWKKELGVNIHLARQEWKVYLHSLSSLDYSVARSSWIGDYPDPNTFLDMFLAGGGNNRTGWGDERYDRFLSQAGDAMGGDARMELLRKAEEILVVEQVPVFPLYYYVGIQLYDSEKIGGIQGNILDWHPVRTMYRKGGKREER